MVLRFFKMKLSLAQGPIAVISLASMLSLFFFKLMEIKFMSVITEPVLVIHGIPSSICSPIYGLEGYVNSKEKYLVPQDADRIYH